VSRRQGVDDPAVSCAFVCHDGGGRIVLYRRSERCRDEHGTWDSGAGALEHGESFEDAVTREVREEFGATPKRIDLLGVRNVLRTIDGVPTHWVALLFAVEVDPAEVRIGEPEKMDELGWFTLDALPEPLHSQFLPQLPYLRRIAERDGLPYD
jgi:ADP-ribose pyrophosphatase YjhB (NUDIX family)